MGPNRVQWRHAHLSEASPPPHVSPPRPTIWCRRAQPSARSRGDAALARHDARGRRGRAPRRRPGGAAADPRGGWWGPAGGPFWRPARINRLTQVVMLGSAPSPLGGDALGPRAGARRAGPARRPRAATLPRACDRGTRRDPGPSTTARLMRSQRSSTTTGSTGSSTSTSSAASLVSVRSGVTPDLVAGADHLHDWMRAPMCALRLVARAPDLGPWERLDTGERLDLANIGSAALVVPGDLVLGRLGPDRVRPSARGGAARRTAGRPPSRSPPIPASWIDAVSASRAEVQTVASTTVWPTMCAT